MHLSSYWYLIYITDPSQPRTVVSDQYDHIIATWHGTGSSNGETREIAGPTGKSYISTISACICTWLLLLLLLLTLNRDRSEDIHCDEINPSPWSRAYINHHSLVHIHITDIYTYIYTHIYVYIYLYHYTRMFTHIYISIYTCINVTEAVVNRLIATITSETVIICFTPRGHSLTHPHATHHRQRETRYGCPDWHRIYADATQLTDTAVVVVYGHVVMQWTVM